MQPLENYLRLEGRVRQLLTERGTTAERVECLERMDRLWAQMSDEERRAASGSPFAASVR